jgi:hypothetical protein
VAPSLSTRRRDARSVRIAGSASNQGCWAARWRHVEDHVGPHCATAAPGQPAARAVRLPRGESLPGCDCRGALIDRLSLASGHGRVTRGCDPPMTLVSWRLRDPEWKRQGAVEGPAGHWGRGVFRTPSGRCHVFGSTTREREWTVAAGRTTLELRGRRRSAARTHPGGCTTPIRRSSRTGSGASGSTNTTALRSGSWAGWSLPPRGLARCSPGR